MLSQNAYSVGRTVKHLLIIVYLFFSLSTNGAPIARWLPPDFFPPPGPDIEDEIKCYSLPYGAIGFVNHIFTYWTIYWQHQLKHPYWPWGRRPGIKHSKTDYTLALLTFIGTIPLAIYTIVRCHQRWQFILVAVWKSVLSIELVLWTVRAAHDAHDEDKHMSEDGLSTTIIMGSFYSMAVLVGLTGLGSIVKDSWWDEPVRRVTYGFGILAIVLILVFLLRYIYLLWAYGHHRRSLPMLACAVFVVPALFAFYSDWVLAAISHNWAGSPTGNLAQALFWVSFNLQQRLIE